MVVKEKLISVITDDNKRKKLQFVCVNLFFAGVSAFMTVLNIITNKGALTAATALFTVFCLINYFLVKKGGKAGTKLVSVIFMAEIVMLDTFFIVSGNPDGFSVIWVAMLPYCSMLLFGRKQAVILSVAAGMRDFDALVQSADKALYCAKVSGRNRVVCGTGDGSTPKIIM